VSLIDAAYERTTRDGGTVVAWLRGVHVTRALADRVDQFPMSGGGYAVVVYDPETDALEDVVAPLGFTQAKEAYRDRR
jgi:hypothetical protein